MSRAWVVVVVVVVIVVVAAQTDRGSAELEANGTGSARRAGSSETTATMHILGKLLRDNHPAKVSTAHIYICTISEDVFHSMH